MTILLLLVIFSTIQAQQTEVNNSKRQVLLNVSVYSKEIVFLKHLKAENFEIYEDNKRREITSFKQTDEPISIGILFDSSGSMISGGIDSFSLFPSMVRGLNGFLDRSHSENEYFIIKFDEKPHSLLDITENVGTVKNVLNNLVETEPSGRKNMYDAVKLGFDKISSASYEKKVLILVSDGTGKFDSMDINKLAKRKNILLYMVTIPTFYFDLLKTMDLENFIENSGGILFKTDSLIGVNKGFELLANELRSQYIIGFEPNVSEKKEDWREIKVKVTLSKEDEKKFGKVSVKFRKGYYF